MRVSGVPHHCQHLVLLVFWILVTTLKCLVLSYCYFLSPFLPPSCLPPSRPPFSFIVILEIEPGPYTYLAPTLSLGYIPSPNLWLLFLRQVSFCCPGWFWTQGLLTSASRVTGITGTSHLSPYSIVVLIHIFLIYDMQLLLVFFPPLLDCMRAGTCICFLRHSRFSVCNNFFYQVGSLHEWMTQPGNWAFANQVVFGYINNFHYSLS